MSAVPTSAWHRDKLRRDDDAFTEDQQGMDTLMRPSGRERGIKIPMVEVKTLPQLHRAGADQPVRNYYLLYIFSLQLKMILLQKILWGHNSKTERFFFFFLNLHKDS